MAFRGRGRGHGGFGDSGFRAAKQEKFDLFPEIEELRTEEGVKVDPSFAVWYNKFQRYWNSSPYYVEDENGGAKSEEKEKHGVKRVRWNPEADMQKLDVFEMLEQKYQGQEINEKDEEEGEDEKLEEEYSDDGDYNQTSHMHMYAKNALKAPKVVAEH